LTYPEFREAVLKMSCLGKLKLGGNSSSSLPEDIKVIEQQKKAKIKQALSGAATTGVLKKANEDGDDLNEELLGVFEKEFDVTEMTQLTVENMFKYMGLKPDPKLIPNSPAGKKPAANSIVRQSNASKALIGDGYMSQQSPMSS